ncbi:hypothetical protein BFF78_29565 [Streptomyces fodineus]|uniref:Uncharacterized protein n=1 Tax=Streptomyces fodineus TaxID=1904616 RepID=A0A1D7YGA0_9ACTN|nr:hypothetical protein [Streptomyces fodineus]AOR34648.1 hypothetical protein BFF78_29565 [Streptomyces fodineus]
MTTTPVAEPLTVRAFLLGREDSDAGDALVGPLHGGGTARALLDGVRPLTAAADQAVERELAGVVDSFLGQDLFDVAAGGWRKHAALTAAARRTRETPGSEEVLALASHEVTSSHRPYVDVFLDGVKIGTLDVELTLVFRIAGLVAVVRDAHLVAVRSGDCVLEGRLGVQQITLAEREGKLDLPGVWHLHAPIPLLRDRPAPPPTPESHSPRPPQPPPPPPAAAPGRRRLHWNGWNGWRGRRGR